MTEQPTFQDRTFSDSAYAPEPELVQPPDTRRMSDDDKAKLRELQERQADEERAASEPNEDNFTHHVHLADGRTVKSLTGAGTVYSETVDDGEGGKKERLTPIIGTYER